MLAGTPHAPASPAGAVQHQNVFATSTAAAAGSGTGSLVALQAQQPPQQHLHGSSGMPNVLRPPPDAWTHHFSTADVTAGINHHLTQQQQHQPPLQQHGTMSGQFLEDPSAASRAAVGATAAVSLPAAFTPPPLTAAAQPFMPVAAAAPEAAQGAWQAAGSGFGRDRGSGKDPSKPRGRSGPKSKFSPFIGVSQYKRTGRWEAHIWDSSSTTRGSAVMGSKAGKGKQLHLGSFLTAGQAARAYDRAALLLRGPTAALNFPLEDYSNDPVLQELSQMSRHDMVLALRKTCGMEMEAAAVEAFHAKVPAEAVDLLHDMTAPSSDDVSMIGAGAAVAAAAAGVQQDVYNYSTGNDESNWQHQQQQWGWQHQQQLEMQGSGYTDYQQQQQWQYDQPQYSTQHLQHAVLPEGHVLPTAQTTVPPVAQQTVPSTVQQVVVPAVQHISAVLPIASSVPDGGMMSTSYAYNTTETGRRTSVPVSNLQYPQQQLPVSSQMMSSLQPYGSAPLQGGYYQAAVAQPPLSGPPSGSYQAGLSGPPVSVPPSGPGYPTSGPPSGPSLATPQPGTDFHSLAGPPLGPTPSLAPPVMVYAYDSPTIPTGPGTRRFDFPDYHKPPGQTGMPGQNMVHQSVRELQPGAGVPCYWPNYGAACGGAGSSTTGSSSGATGGSSSSRGEHQQHQQHQQQQHDILLPSRVQQLPGVPYNTCSALSQKQQQHMSGHIAATAVQQYSPHQCNTGYQQYNMPVTTTAVHVEHLQGLQHADLNLTRCSASGSCANNTDTLNPYSSIPHSPKPLSPHSFAFRLHQPRPSKHGDCSGSAIQAAQMHVPVQQQHHMPQQHQQHHGAATDAGRQHTVQAHAGAPPAFNSSNGIHEVVQQQQQHWAGPPTAEQQIAGPMQRDMRGGSLISDDNSATYPPIKPHNEACPSTWQQWHHGTGSAAVPDDIAAGTRDKLLQQQPTSSRSRSAPATAAAAVAADDDDSGSIVPIRPAEKLIGVAVSITTSPAQPNCSTAELTGQRLAGQLGATPKAHEPQAPRLLSNTTGPLRKIGLINHDDQAMGPDRCDGQADEAGRRPCDHATGPDNQAGCQGRASASHTAEVLYEAPASTAEPTDANKTACVSATAAAKLIRGAAVVTPGDPDEAGVLASEGPLRTFSKAMAVELARLAASDSELAASLGRSGSPRPDDQAAGSNISSSPERILASISQPSPDDQATGLDGTGVLPMLAPSSSHARLDEQADGPDGPSAASARLASVRPDDLERLTPYLPPITPVRPDCQAMGPDSNAAALLTRLTSGIGSADLAETWDRVQRGNSGLDLGMLLERQHLLYQQHSLPGLEQLDVLLLSRQVSEVPTAAAVCAEAKSHVSSEPVQLPPSSLAVAAMAVATAATEAPTAASPPALVTAEQLSLSRNPSSKRSLELPNLDAALPMQTSRLPAAKRTKSVSELGHACSESTASGSDYDACMNADQSHYREGQQGDAAAGVACTALVQDTAGAGQSKMTTAAVLPDAAAAATGHTKPLNTAWWDMMQD